jgi:hypothetical protein
MERVDVTLPVRPTATRPVTILIGVNDWQMGIEPST